MNTPGGRPGRHDIFDMGPKPLICHDRAIERDNGATRGGTPRAGRLADHLCAWRSGARRASAAVRLCCERLRRIVFRAPARYARGRVKGEVVRQTISQRPGKTSRGIIWRALASRAATARAAVAVLALGLLLGGCITQTYQRGYIVPEGALEQIPLGASQEQVLIVLGTPSTVATVSGEVFYYISQRAEQTSFLPQQEVDRRVVAVYFDRNRKVERLANYGIKDGRIFDFVSRTTPTAGQELNYIAYMFKALKWF